MNAHQIVEAVLFASDAPLTADEVARADERLDEDVVEESIRFLQAEYDDAERAFQVVELAEGYQILTRPEFAPYLERFDNVPRPSRLSGPALETLAIIAYRQPLGRIEIEYVRGVGSAGVLKTLQDRELVEVVGRAEGLGRPVLYGTTTRFLEHFGFKSLEELPRPEELPVILRERIPIGPEEEADEGEGASESAGEGGGGSEQLALGGGVAGAQGVDGAVEAATGHAAAPEAAGSGEADTAGSEGAVGSGDAAPGDSVPEDSAPEDSAPEDSAAAEDGDGPATGPAAGPPDGASAEPAPEAEVEARDEAETPSG